jgi:hypothetical protein
MSQVNQRIVQFAQGQNGVASIAFAVVMLLLVSAALTGALRLSSDGLQDAVTNDQHLAAIFLAESGVERAHAMQTQAFYQGNFGATCQALKGTGPFQLGRGSFGYTDSTYLGMACPGGASAGLAGECCTFSVEAVVDGTRREVQARVETADPNGVAGQASTTTYLNLKTVVANTAIVTNLAYRAKDRETSTSNAVVEQCANMGGNSLSTGCSTKWDLNSGGNYSVNGMGVFASIPSANASYTIQTRFKTSNSPAVRQYVMTGALFPPVNPVSGVTFGSTHFQGPTGPGSSRTASSSSSTSFAINVPTDWCMGSVSNASEADTMVYGFSTLSGVATDGAPATLTDLTLGNSASPHARFSRLLHMRGLKDNSLKSATDYYLFSQMWTLYNPAYKDLDRTATSSGTSITLSAAPTQTVQKGTVLVAYNAPSKLAPVASRAKVTANALLVPTTSSMPALGDAVFGPHVVSGTYISGAAEPAVNGFVRFAVTPAQKPDDVERPIVLRAAVMANSSTASLVLSRPPASPLSGDKLCGGLCALLHGSAGADGNLNLSGITSGDNWSTGLMCLSGVNPGAIEVISGPPLRRVAWNEVVR